MTLKYSRDIQLWELISSKPIGFASGRTRPAGARGWHREFSARKICREYVCGIFFRLCLTVEGSHVRVGLGEGFAPTLGSAEQLVMRSNV